MLAELPLSCNNLGTPVQVGCGADELIDLLMRCVLDPGDSILDCPPTFTMYKFDAAVNNANVITVPRNQDFSIDVPGETVTVHAFTAYTGSPQTQGCLRLGC